MHKRFPRAFLEIDIYCMCTVSFCCLFVIAVLIVRSIIHQCSTYYYLDKLGLCSRKYQDHQEQKDVYRRYNAKEGNSANKNNKNSKDIFMLFVTKHQFSIIVKRGG